MKTILFFEPEESLRYVIKHVLTEKAGYNVLMPPWSDILEIARTTPIDLLLIGINDESTWDAVYQKTQEPDLKGIPLLIIDGTRGTLVCCGERREAIHSIRKPFGIEELLKAVDNGMRERKNRTA